MSCAVKIVFFIILLFNKSSFQLVTRYLPLLWCVDKSILHPRDSWQLCVQAFSIIVAANKYWGSYFCYIWGSTKSMAEGRSKVNKMCALLPAPSLPPHRAELECTQLLEGNLMCFWELQINSWKLLLSCCCFPRNPPWKAFWVPYGICQHTALGTKLTYVLLMVLLHFWSAHWHTGAKQTL